MQVNRDGVSILEKALCRITHGDDEPGATVIRPARRGALVSGRRSVWLPPAVWKRDALIHQIMS